MADITSSTTKSTSVEVTSVTMPSTHLSSNITGTQPYVLHSTQSQGTGVNGSALAAGIAMLVLGVTVFAFLCYLKRTGKLYKLLPFKRRARSSSISSSRRPLEADEQDDLEAEHEPEHGDLPKPRDGNREAFTIDDFDLESVDIDSQSRGTNDEYFYDEVFGKSSFEDEVTNASMRKLYLASEDDEALDVDEIVRRIKEEQRIST